tara:strand:- start:1160 stop:1777 length:618 start_codon:yes stop_codon:yes gene_type:complete
MKNKPDKKLLAWQITEESEGNGCVVFSSHGLAARRIGANELNSDFEYVSGKRASEFDSYANEGKVPMNVLIANGWWFDCFSCGHKVHEEDDDKDTSKYVYNESLRAVFCDDKCKCNRDKIIADQKDKFEQFKAIITQKRPDLTFSEHKGEYPCITMSAHFTFPNAKHTGTVRCDELDDIKWSVAGGDLDSWKAYELAINKTKESA